MRYIVEGACDGSGAGLVLVLLLSLLKLVLSGVRLRTYTHTLSLSHCCTQVMGQQSREQQEEEAHESRVPFLWMDERGSEGVVERAPRRYMQVGRYNIDGDVGGMWWWMWQSNVEV